MNCFLDFLEYSVTHSREIGYTKSLGDQHILASLTELHEKVLSVNSPYKTQFKFKITLSMAFGLRQHCELELTQTTDEVVINHIIGHIHQQTQI